MSVKEIDLNGTKSFDVRVTVYDKNGKRHFRRKRGLKTFKQAKTVERELIESLGVVRNQAPEVTWKDWHQKVVERLKLTLMPGTVMNYEGRLRKWTYQLWGHRPITEITRDDVYEVIYELLPSDVSCHGRKTMLKLIRKVFELAVEEGLIGTNPAKGIQVKVKDKQQAVLNATEVGILLQEARATDHPFYPIWAFALLTGMRSGEMYALKPQHLDRENKLIHVVESWCSKSGFGPTKTGKRRVVEICDDLELLLQELDAKHGRNREFILPHLGQWKTGEQAQVTRQFCKAIGVTPVKFHDLRATFITNLLSRGVPLVQVMALVGHSQLKTTDVYVRLAGVNIKGATQKLSYSLPRQKLAEVINLSFLKN